MSQRATSTGCDGGHGDGAAPPVGSAVEILPDVFDVEWIAADEAGKHVLREIAGDSEFTAVERGVAEAVEACVGLDLERYEVAVGRADDEAGVGDLHDEFFGVISM